MSSPRGRLLYIDWLRVLATLGVFLLHTLAVFDNADDWLVKNDRTYFGVTALMGFLHFWIMPLFFLLAGTGSEMALRRMSVSDFLRKRVTRLLIPYVFGSIVICPFQRYFEEVHHGRFSGSLLDFAATYLEHLNFDQSYARYFSAIGGHLWFLGWLFVFTLLSLPLSRLGRHPLSLRLLAGLERLFEHPAGLLAYGLLFGAIQVMLRPQYPDYGNWADVIYWGVFYLSGIFLAKVSGMAPCMERSRFLSLASGLLALGGIFLLNQNHDMKACFMDGSSAWPCITFNLLTGIVAWSLTSSILGFGSRHLTGESRFLTYGSEASLAFYVLHHPVIGVIAFYVVAMPLNALAKGLLIGFTAFPLTVVLYETSVRRFKLMRFLFGLKP